MPNSQYNNFNDFLQDIQSLTAFHGDLDLEYRQTDELRYLLENSFETKDKHLTGQIKAPKTTPTVPLKVPENKPKKPVSPVSEKDIDNCRQLISECNSCPHRKPPKFGIGTSNNPFIFIICDRNSSDPSRPMEEAEESLLGKMLQAIKIKPGQIFVTNIVKCNVADSTPKTEQEMTTNCLSHTIQQIRLMQPSLICTMGQLSSQTILNSTNQLMALRGHFHTYMDIPLMATYHPAQLIALPELKKATWYDLQLMQRRLAMGK